MRHLGGEATTQAKHWERKAVSKTASESQDSERIKLIRYRNHREMELEQFQQKKNQEKRHQSRYEETNFLEKIKRGNRGNSFKCYDLSKYQRLPENL